MAGLNGYLYNKCTSTIKDWNPDFVTTKGETLLINFLHAVTASTPRKPSCVPSSANEETQTNKSTPNLLF